MSREYGVENMSAILSELRLLEAKRASGAITSAQFELQKSALLDDIPDAFEPDVLEGHAIEVEPPKQSKPNPDIWDTLLLWIIAAVFCATAVWAITGNLGTAATLGVTVLAAFTIKLFVALE
jgi:hypothetical protein